VRSICRGIAQHNYCSCDKLCITWIIHKQFWGYKVEDKLYLGVREQKRLNTTALRVTCSPERWSHLTHFCCWRPGHALLPDTFLIRDIPRHRKALSLETHLQELYLSTSHFCHNISGLEGLLTKFQIIHTRITQQGKSDVEQGRFLAIHRNKDKGSTNPVLFWTRQKAFGFHKKWEISWLAEQLITSQEELM
jgi:hypothetical protein